MQTRLKNFELARNISDGCFYFKLQLSKVIRFFELYVVE